MIKFSERQLKTPKYMRPVYLVTAGQSKYGRAIPEKRTEELCIDAFTMAAQLINMTPAGMDRFCLPSLKIPVAFVTSAELVDDWLTVDTLTIEPEERRISILAKAEVPLTDGPESLGRIIIGEMGPEIRAAIEEGRELPSRKAAG